MFTNEVKERHERVVSLHGVSTDVLKNIIGFMYTGNIELTNENVQDIFMAASMFEMIHLIGLCADHMIQEICTTNCIDLLIFGNHFACTKLTEKARVYVLEHFTDIVNDNDRLFDLDFELFEDLVASDDISVEKEEMVFEIIIKWVGKEMNRLKYLSQLFKAVRLLLVCEDFIHNTIKTNMLINEDASCKYYLSLYDTYKASMLLMETDSELQALESTTSNKTGLNSTPRLGMFNHPMMIFSSGANSREERSLTAFDPITFKNYVALSPHSTFDFKFKVDYFKLTVTADNRIYFLGGIFYDDHHFENSGFALADVYEYRLKEIKWEKRAAMNIKRCLFSSCCHGNSIYVTGGKVTYPKGDPTDSVECYNQEYDYWGFLSPVPIKIYKHASCATSDVIFLFGGQNEADDYLDTVLRYDIPHDTWSLLTTQMLKPRAQFSAFPYNNKIYLVGGVTLHENILTVAIYEPNRNRWTYGDDFPEERKLTSAAFQDGTIYVCGGVPQLGISGRRWRQGEFRDLYKYEIDKSQWSKVVELVQYGNTEACAMAVLNTKFLEQSDFISSL